MSDNIIGLFKGQTRLAVDPWKGHDEGEKIASGSQEKMD
jgi:hypothetical protein